MDNTLLIWVNTVLLAMLGFCIAAVSRWFFHKFDKMMSDMHLMAQKSDLDILKAELGRKIDSIHCIRSHEEVKKYLHTHGKAGDAGEAVYVP